MKRLTLIFALAVLVLAGCKHDKPDNTQDGTAFATCILSGVQCYQVTFDNMPPATISLKEKYRSDFWKLSVLRGQALKTTPVKVSKGKHTLRIKALDDHIIMDQWMLDFKKDRKFYVIPCV